MYVIGVRVRIHEHVSARVHTDSNPWHHSMPPLVATQRAVATSNSLSCIVIAVASRFLHAMAVASRFLNVCLRIDSRFLSHMQAGGLQHEGAGAGQSGEGKRRACGWQRRRGWLQWSVDMI